MPAFEAASKMDGPDQALVFFESDEDRKNLPVAVPFAGVALTSELTHSRGYFGKELKGMALSYEPDFFLVAAVLGSEGTIMTGQADQMWFRVPPGGRALLAFAHRVCPSDIGVVWNEYSMITDVTNPSLQEAGLLEGDTITAINGAAVTFGMDSPSHVALLSILPGEEFALDWIRPGVGKVEGVGVALENPNNISALTDGIEALLEQEEKERMEKKVGSGKRTYL